MAETTTTRGTNNLYFIVGGLVVAIAIGAFAYHNGYFGGRTTTDTSTEKTVTPSADGTSTTTTTTKSTSP